MLLMSVIYHAPITAGNTNRATHYMLANSCEHFTFVTFQATFLMRRWAMRIALHGV